MGTFQVKELTRVLIAQTVRSKLLLQKEKKPEHKSLNGKSKTKEVRELLSSED